MYTSEYIYVYKKVLTVSTRKGTDICEFAQHGVRHKTICNMKNVNCEHVYVCKGVLTVSTRKGTTICKFAQHWVIYKSIYDIT